MNERNELLMLLKQKTTDAIYPLILERKIEEFALEQLVFFLEESTRVLKNDRFIYKEILQEIVSSSTSIKAEAERVDSIFLKEIGSKLDKCLNLIIIGESIDDRKPGVPRII